mmetsp:Transcript_29069/g.84075  ORF Transcript_29069/g.84075 Transcript_29069/m.84075 type:complete len:104 (+) Transcript_29069:911-1222(+)
MLSPETTNQPAYLPAPQSPAPFLTHTHSENNPRLPTSAASIHPSIIITHASSRLVSPYWLGLPACLPALIGPSVMRLVPRGGHAAVAPLLLAAAGGVAACPWL